MKLDNNIIVTLLLSAGLTTASIACPLSKLGYQRVWSGNVADWSRAESGAKYQFGEENITYVGSNIRAVYPLGSYDPAAARNAAAPLGGAQFKTTFARMNLSSQNEIGLRYSITFDQNFQFVRGGKLPGLFGGTANSGGVVPTGTDGFSVRFGWQAEGSGALLAYLPTSARWGTLFGLGKWHFTPGRTTELAVYVRLNTPKVDDGIIAVWADDILVAYAPDVIFRTVENLRLDGFLFSTFFGGSTPDWATPVTTGSVFGTMEVFKIDALSLTRCAGPLGELRNRREIK